MKLKQSFNKWIVKTHNDEFDTDSFYAFKTEEDVLAFISGEYVMNYWDHEVHCDYEEIIKEVYHKITYDIEY